MQHGPVYADDMSQLQSDNPEAQFLHGHLAVLLALLARQNAHAVEIIRSEADMSGILVACRDWVRLSASFMLSFRTSWHPPAG